MILQWWEGSFQLLQEFPLLQEVKEVEWCGQEYLLVAQKKDYQLVSLANGSYTYLIPTGGKSNSTPRIIPLPGYNELLLLKDSVGVFVGLDGKLTRKFGMTLSENPSQLAVITPYAVAVFDKFIEVRSLHRDSSYAVVQTISLGNKASFVSYSNSSSNSEKKPLLVGTQSSIHMLVSVPLLEQITQLGKNGEFEDALRLCDSISDEDHVWRLTKSSLHQRDGWALFARKIFVEAIRQFSLSSKSPRHVLRLYPSLLPEAARAAVHSLPKLVDLKDCRDPDPKSRTDLPAFKALLPYLQQQRKNILDFAKEKKDLNRRNSFGVLENADGLIEDAMDQGWGGLDLIQLVDTAMLHCFLILEMGGELLKFCQQGNQVEIVEAEAALQKSGHYIELVLLYRQLDRHRDALELLRSLVTSPEAFAVPPHASTPENLKGTEGAIEYLLYLDKQYEDLIFEHSKWIGPEGAVRIFKYRHDILTETGKQKVLPFLKEAGAVDLQIQYLEFLIERHSKENGKGGFTGPGGVGGGGGGGESLKVLQDKLAILLLDHLGDAGEEATKQRHRERLHELLLTCSSPEWMLSQLPEGMLEERALILKRMGKDKELVQVLLRKNWCEDGAVAEEEQVRKFLEDEQLHTVDPVQVLSCLPDTLPLSSMLGYIETSFSQTLQERKKMSILKSLTKQEALQVRGELVNHQKQSVVVSPESVCRACYKRIQNSVFILDNDGRLIHYNCYRRLQNGGK